jgi:hypothetical protein
MNLQDLASLAEIVSGVAVVVSLIYVGIQVNESTAAIRSSAASDATRAVQSWYLEMGTNRQASDVWFNAMRSPDPLPPHDEFQFLMSMHTAMLGMQNSYLLSKEGTLDAEFREAVTIAIVAVKDLPGMARYWRQRRGFLHAGFAEHVDGLLAQDAIETLDIYSRASAMPDH